MGVLGVTVILNCFMFPYQQLLPVFARDVLNTGPVGLGLLASADGIGALISALVIMTQGDIKRTGRFFLIGSLGMTSFILLFSASLWLGISIALLIMGGIAHIGFSTMQSTIILSAASEQMRGRAMGTLVLAIGSQPLGMLFVGGLANGVGAPLAISLSTLICLISTSAIAILMPKLRQY
jgi:hypothetical protein